jgi:hypothetical protein
MTVLCLMENNKCNFNLTQQDAMSRQYLLTEEGMYVLTFC